MDNEELLQIAKERAANNMLSEAYCLEIAAGWYEAAEIARMRRSVGRHRPDLFNDSLGRVRQYQLSIEDK